MKTETENKQDDPQNASAVRDCPDSTGSDFPSLVSEHPYPNINDSSFGLLYDMFLSSIRWCDHLINDAIDNRDSELAEPFIYSIKDLRSRYFQLMGELEIHFQNNENSHG